MMAQAGHDEMPESGLEVAAETAPENGPGLSILHRINLALIALPVAVRATIQHMMGSTEPSKYIDLRSEVIVAIVRALTIPRQPPLRSVPILGPLLFSGPSPSESSSEPSSGARSVSATQRLLNHDTGVRGPLWVSNYTAPGGANAEENTALRDALVDVIKRLHDEEGEGRNGKPMPDIAWPSVAPVEAEWTGHRTGARECATLPSYTNEAERYNALMSHITAPQPTTVLYLHGGAMYLLDPSTHRGITLSLAQRIGGRCYSVRYRLAPQYAFPTQILDALVSYLTLLYPPPGAFHEPVSAQHIVFAGDSAGGNICLALTRVLLDFQRNGTQVLWHGSKRQVPLPAGIALNSPWVDISNSSPSWQPSSKSCRPAFDYLPPMPVANMDSLDRPPCEAWPANPPRHFLYTESSLITHPLVSLFTSSPEGWQGAPPMYVCVGWEMLADEVCYITTTRLYNGGKGASSVVFEQYEAMPHCFAMVLPHLSGANRCLDGWGGFIRRAVEQPETLRNGAGTSFTRIEATTLKETPIDPETLIPYTEDEIKATVRERLAAVEAKPASTKTSAKL